MSLDHLVYSNILKNIGIDGFAIISSRLNMPKSKNLIKSYHHLERIVKGFANHRRLAIMELLNKEAELSVAEIAKRLKINFKTASEHLRRLAIAGLIMKRSDGLSVRHRLTSRGLSILKFLRILE